MNARRNILKNVVFRRILEIRAIMAKPKLSTILKLFAEEDSEAGKDKIIRKLHKIYGKGTQKNDLDFKYERLMLSYDRIQKVLDFQMMTIDEMMKRVIIYTNRREEREANGGDI